MNILKVSPRHIYLFLLVILRVCQFFYGSGGAAVQEAGPAAEAEEPPETEPEPLPKGFRGIQLGLDIETVKSRLEEDSYFIYRGEPDVSMLADPDSSLIECRGFRFIDRAFFQFYEGRLYIIILKLNPEELDYYSVYSVLSNKYGKSDSLDTKQVLWQNEEVRLSLERPLSVKYIELDTFTSLVEEGEADKTFRAVTRREFLEMF